MLLRKQSKIHKHITTFYFKFHSSLQFSRFQYQFYHETAKHEAYCPNHHLSSQEEINIGSTVATTELWSNTITTIAHALGTQKRTGNFTTGWHLVYACSLLCQTYIPKTNYNDLTKRFAQKMSFLWTEFDWFVWGEWHGYARLYTIIMHAYTHNI